MTSTIRIDNIKPTAKSLVITSNGKEYFAKKNSGLDGMAGSTIEAETEASDYNGKHYVWIQKWKKAEAAPAAPAPAPRSEPQPSFNADGINLAFLPFVSNCVAHAIQAGKVETPQELQRWAQAAYSAANSLKDVPF